MSDSGDIRNKKTGNVLKPSINHGGYKYVCISLDANEENKRRKTIIIHKAVAYNYLDNPNNLNCVDHIDCNKLNNHYTNLEWVTSTENSLRAYMNGLFQPPSIETNVHKKLTEAQVKEIRSLYSNDSMKYTQREIAERYNVSRSAVTQIINYRTYKNVV